MIARLGVLHNSNRSRGIPGKVLVWVLLPVSSLASCANEGAGDMVLVLALVYLGIARPIVKVGYWLDWLRWRSVRWWPIE